ncbi:MAG: glucosyl-3-phosphoglycerate synthase [Candidatus Diapherotrites archaeon]|uniref:Glucosyl-3-phosphoglycerate synthase n=1 Tax=Candidatus Iainarchaeum sp. TaxID=3101447 RepID=A0A939C935_9ARCH|nr:glucosyl-3-phosphoglycerate synthase [Candidatus Diapherotrites archaeon]
MAKKAPSASGKSSKAYETSALGWFNSHTFHNSKFEDVDALIELKHQQDRKISVGIPTLNEEKNVANVVSTIRKSLYEKKHLIDEIAIIDSGSTDRTVELAEKAGARVITSEKHLREFGAFYGKGENLWKSLHTLRGDIICWIDADIENIHPKFVYGLVGPMLQDRELGYVKGFYRRPLKFGDKIVSYGGGRTTEICIRPIFNLYFPELTGFIQPLSGEYAGKRKVLERVPFFVGYGVETGLLIDISRKFGLNAMAQVDLDERVHRNQETVALGRMAFGIMQVVASRLGKQQRQEFLQEFCTVYRFPEIREPEKEGEERQYFLNEKEIVERERPPISRLHDYRMKKKWNKDTLAKLADFLRESKRRHRLQTSKDRGELE